MESQQLFQLKPMLQRYLERFDDCFARKDTRGHLPAYVEGQLSELPEKTVAPIATHAGVAPRTLQEFLSLLRWDHDRMRDRLEQMVAREHAGPHPIGILDETSYVKKGDKTPGVKRQWCGAAGKQENCIVTVHLGYAEGDFHCLLDGELFLPEDWAADRHRCQEAGIPNDVAYRPKWQIGLELYDRAVANGVPFEWLVFDEAYGGKPAFLQALGQRNQGFVGEVPKTFRGWIDPPPMTVRPYRHGRGRGRSIPRLVSGSPKARTVQWLLRHHPALKNQPWQRWRIRDGEKGPMIWEAQHAPFYPKKGRLPLGEHRLVVARNALKPQELKFFVSNAPSEPPVERLLLAGFSRWHIERCFQDGKGEVGLDHYEGRGYLGLKRHLAISAVSYLFLARVQKTWAGKKSRGHRGSSPHRGCRLGAPLVVERSDLGETRREPPNDHRPATTRRGQSASQPDQANPAKTPAIRHQTHPRPKV